MSLIEHDKTLRRPLRELNDKGRLILAALVYGLDGKMATKYGVEPGKALTQHQVADIYKLRRAYIRGLMADPLFRNEFAHAIALRRQGYVPHAIDRMATLIDSDNEGIALRASESMIGDPKGFSVNVNVNNTTAVALKPGYIIRLDRSRDEHEPPNPATIDA